MAKPYPDRTGSGQHIHLSLADPSGKNIFDDGSSEGSETLRFAAGRACRADARKHGDVRAEREFLPPFRARHVRARQPALGF